MSTSNPYASKVFDKFAQLKQWQSEQHERLIREQEELRQKLAEEQQKRLESYAVENDLGVSTKVQHSDAMMATNTQYGQWDVATRKDNDDLLHGVCRMSATDTDEETQSIGETHDDSSESLIEKDACSRVSDSEDEAQKIILKPGEGTSPKPQRKFSFLKRGEGLSRFRMSADDILKQRQRLIAARAKSSNNKPQSNLAANRKQTAKKHVKVVEKAAPVKPMETQIVNKQPSSRQDSKLQAEVKPTNKPKQASSVIVNNGKMMVTRAPTLPTLQLQASKQPATSKMVAPRMPAPPLLQSAASTKPTSTASQLAGPSWASMLAQPFLPQATVSQPFVLQPVCQMPFKPVLPQPTPSEPMLSKQMLSPPVRNLFPDNTSKPADTSRKLELRELRMFEHLEQIAADSSFCSSSSVVTKFVERGYISSSVQSTPSKHPQDNEDFSIPLSSTPFSNPTIQNAKELIEKFAMYKFGNKNKNCDAPQPPVTGQVGNAITLNLHPLHASQDSSEESSSDSSPESELHQAGPSSQHHKPESSQHVRFQEQPEVREVESEAWSGEDSSLDSSSESESVMSVRAGVTQVPASQACEIEESSSSSEEERSCSEKSLDEKLALGSLVHSRLEQLQREIESVLAQQAALAAQKEELSQERQRLADAVIKKENQQTQLEKERKNLAAVTRRRQSESRAEIDQLKQQLSDLQVVWREKEARWAAAQASQRTQMRQLSLENKQLAFQIKQLKSAQAQAKKVHFAPVLTKKQTIKQNEKQINEKDINRRSTLPSRKTAGEQNHFRTRSASPCISDVPHFTSEPRPLSPETLRTRSASPSVSIAPLATTDEPWYLETRATLPSKPGVKSNYVCGDDDIKISCVDDIDAVTAKYNELCFPGPSPSSSLVLNTPRGINKAYMAIFKENADVNSNTEEPMTKQQNHSIPRGTNEAYTTVISENTRFKSSTEQLPTKQQNHYIPQGTNEAYTTVISENTRFNSNTEEPMTKQQNHYYIPRGTNKAFTTVVSENTRFNSNTEEPMTKQQNHYIPRETNEAFTTVVSENSSFNTSAEHLSTNQSKFENNNVAEHESNEKVDRKYQPVSASPQFVDTNIDVCAEMDRTQRRTTSSGPCRTVLNEDGSKQLWFPSGNTIKVSADGATRKVVFYNGDIQETLAREGIVRYFYAETKACHETFSDGTQIIMFPDGQREVTYPNGSREVTYPDESVLHELEDGRQEIRNKDGTQLLVEKDGTSVLLLPNGRREVRTKESTRLEYPDGTVRTQYPSGLLETKYPDGRVRIKDSTGKLILDTHFPVTDQQ